MCDDSARDCGVPSNSLLATPRRMIEREEAERLQKSLAFARLVENTALGEESPWKFQLRRAAYAH